MKDEYNALNTQRQPGPLVVPLGGRVEQYYALDSAVPVGGKLGSGGASLWAEQLSTSAPDVDVLLRYAKSNGWLDNQPAMITRRVGKGSITYLGAVLDPGLMRNVVAWATSEAQLKAEFPDVPAGVEVCRRVQANHSVFVLINHGSEGVHVALPSTMNDVLHDSRVTSVDLEPQGVALLATDVP